MWERTALSYSNAVLAIFECISSDFFEGFIGEWIVGGGGFYGNVREGRIDQPTFMSFFRVFNIISFIQNK